MQELTVIHKNCGECTKCCEGWLHAKVKGNTLSPGNPCIFLKMGPEQYGCSIYDDRPIKPCRIFNCLWVLEDMPDHLKPSVSGVIATQNKIDGHYYIFLVNAPNYPSSDLIEWCYVKYVHNDKNLVYFNKNDELVYYGSESFCNTILINKDVIMEEHNKLKKHYIK